MKKMFTIGASTIPGEVILPHLMPKILQRNPDIAFRLVVTNSQTTFEDDLTFLFTLTWNDLLFHQMVQKR